MAEIARNNGFSRPIDEHIFTDEQALVTISDDWNSGRLACPPDATLN
jgi:hypothetical protein